jgi:chromosome partitioning protein
VGAHIIVLGNEKGGSGKSTTAMHLTVALLSLGRKVGVLDLDARQKTLTRYIQNRERFVAQSGVNLAMPDYRYIVPSTDDSKTASRKEERGQFEQYLAELWQHNHFVVIDSPGSDTFLSRLAHNCADTIVTPLNDSFVDFDLLAQINPKTYEVEKPSIYAELVWDSRKRRALQTGGSIDWIVMRNRLAALDTKNKRRLESVLDKLAGRVGFRIGPGFGDRVIFREMFPLGLTVLDLGEAVSGVKLSMSHVAARQEVRDLIDLLDLPGLEEEEIPVVPETQALSA